MKTIRTTIIYLIVATGLCQAYLASHSNLEACSSESSMVVETEKRQLSHFKRIDIKGAFTFEITRANHCIATITCEKNILSHIVTEVKNQKLYVFADQSICTRKKINISISAADIVAIDASGASDITVAGIENKSISINMDGAGDLNISGNTDIFSATLSGAANLYADKLRSETTRVSIFGASNANVYASKKLALDISGVGDVICHGNPETIEKNISGVGEVITKR